MSTFPCYRKSKANGRVIKFIGPSAGYVFNTNTLTESPESFSDSWIEYNSKSTWEDVDHLYKKEEQPETLDLWKTASFGSSQITKVPGGYVMTSHSGHQIFIKDTNKESL